jgi:redox-sensitive bicupin YhaK (pirin superfamily)
MIDRRPFSRLGGPEHGWLKARHQYSFSKYYDPQNMRWGPNRGSNDDEIAPNSGFPPHPHSDMEIIT